MSSEDAAAYPAGLDRVAEGRAALRLAFGVTACFAVVEALGWDATFLAPLLAATMLVKPRAPSLGQGLVVIVLIAVSTHGVLVLTTALIGNPTVLILALSLVLYISFYAHRRGAPELVTLLFQVSAVALPTIAVLSPDGAGMFATTLMSAGVVALVTVWVAHAAFPIPAAVLTDADPANSTHPAEAGPAARHALLDTIVLLPVLYYILDATQVAVVVLIFIVTLLRLHDPQKGQAALGLILGNLVGGIAAVIAYNLVMLNNTLLFFITVCLAASLIFAGRIVTAGDRAPFYAVAFTTFILLLGTGLTPLLGDSGEAFASRLFYVLLASAYAIGGMSLVEHWRNDKS